MRKLSLRMRLTIISVVLLLTCCLGLTAMLNWAAGAMADTIEAATITPALSDGQVAALPMTAASVSRDARDLFLLQSWAGVLLICAVGGVLTWFITGKALRPLGILSREMENCTVETLSRELSIPETRDEVASLTRSFNEMSRKLGDAFSAQRRFAQSAAHELRTPLTVLKAKVDVFSKRPQHTKEEYEELLSLVRRQTDRMAELVNDLLGLTGMDQLSCVQPVDLDSVLREAIQELELLAENNHVTVSLRADRIQVPGNPNLLHRTFANLVENAVKYNVPGGSVDVVAEKENGCAVIRVSDTGPGIPEDQKQQIFEPFYRVDKSRSRQMGGAGLGLATAKAVVDKHSGTITVENGAGGGSVFTVRLKTL